MALSATMALNNSAVQAGMPVTITITITNTSATADTLVSADKRVPGQASAIGGNSLLNGGVINGSGTNGGVTSFSYQQEFFLGEASTQPGGCQNVSPQILLNFGTAAPIPVNGPQVTVSPVPFTPAAKQARTQTGQLDYSSNILSGLASVMGAW